jgi:4-hydroxy-tetrahydrodipicolinate synthase
MAGDYAKALTYQDRLIALHEGLFCEASPAPTKYAASLLGLCDPEVRLPIVPVTAPGREIVRAAMAAAGLLNG